jgi:hypothetical protein
MMEHRGPINIDGLPIESQEFFAGLRPANSRFAGWRWALDDDDDGDKDKGDDTGDGDDGDSGDDDDKSKDAGSDGDTVSREDFDRLRKRMEAADRRASEAEKKIKDAEDAKKDDLTKATEKAAEDEETIKGLQKQVSDLRLENAFLVANKHAWHDPEVALGLARTKGYLEDVVDDDGEVDKKALKKALDRLATEHKYLIKAKVKDDDEPSGPSGTPAGKRSNNQDDDKAKKTQLKERFPILNGR